MAQAYAKAGRKAKGRSAGLPERPFLHSVVSDQNEAVTENTTVASAIGLPASVAKFGSR
jgi:hypothetical protein